MSSSSSPSAVYETLKSETPPIYVDVRTLREFEAGRVPGSVNVPVTLGGHIPIPTFLDDIKKLVAEDDELIIGCKTGRRSKMALKILKENGFDKLTELEGGFDAWEADSSLPIER